MGADCGEEEGTFNKLTFKICHIIYRQISPSLLYMIYKYIKEASTVTHISTLTHLRHFHRSHRVNMQAEDLRAIIAHDEALKFLLMHRKIACLDV